MDVPVGNTLLPAQLRPLEVHAAIAPSMPGRVFPADSLPPGELTGSGSAVFTVQCVAEDGRN